MYVGTVTLRRTERQFWKMTPRKLTALAKAHAALNNPDGDDQGTSTKKGSTQKVGYIDQLIF